MNVNYEYYRLFYYVCKYHSITRAANVLRMSQPNVTRALNRLEEQLGCKLLVRSTRGVTMTPEGEVLFAHVEIAQEQLQAGESELAGITALESGALTISASETALNVFLLDKLREFHRRYPGVRLRIANHSTPQAIRAVLPALGNEFIVLLKDTSLITVIGGKELLYAAQGIMNRTYEPMFPLFGVALMYLILVMIFTWLLGKLEGRLAKSDRR